MKDSIMNMILHRNFKDCLSQRRQIRRFRKLTSQYQLLINKPVINTMNKQTDTRHFLSSLRQTRRPFPVKDIRPTIAGFGSNDSWQRDGLWMGFRAVSDFHFYEVLNNRLPGATSETHERELKANGFLRFIDEIEKTTPVHAAFFYHSGRHISDELLNQLHDRGIRTVIMSLDDKHQF
jgi:hypothetical protein